MKAAKTNVPAFLTKIMPTNKLLYHLLTRLGWSLATKNADRLTTASTVTNHISLQVYSPWQVTISHFLIWHLAPGRRFAERWSGINLALYDSAFCTLERDSYTVMESTSDHKCIAYCTLPVLSMHSTKHTFENWGWGRGQNPRTTSVPIFSWHSL